MCKLLQRQTEFSASSRSQRVPRCWASASWAERCASAHGVFAGTPYSWTPDGTPDKARPGRADACCWCAVAGCPSCWTLWSRGGSGAAACTSTPPGSLWTQERLWARVHTSAQQALLCPPSFTPLLTSLAPL